MKEVVTNQKKIARSSFNTMINVLVLNSPRALLSICIAALCYSTHFCSADIAETLFLQGQQFYRDGLLFEALSSYTEAMEMDGFQNSKYERARAAILNEARALSKHYVEMNGEDALTYIPIGLSNGTKIFYYAGEPWRDVENRANQYRASLRVNWFFETEWKTYAQRGVPWIRAIFQIPSPLRAEYSMGGLAAVEQNYYDETSQESVLIPENADIAYHKQNALCAEIFFPSPLVIE